MTPDLPIQEPPAAANAVDETLTRGFRWLRFPVELETLFEQETGAARVRQMLLAGFVAIFTYDLFLASDNIIVPQIIQAALVVRLGLVTPLTLLVMAAQYRGLAPWLREAVGAAATVIGGLGAMYLLILSRDPNGPYYVYGLVLITLFANIVLRLRFFYAAAASLAILVIYSVTAPLLTSVAPTVLASNFMFLFSTALLTLFANYSLERDHRLNYLLSLRDRLRRADLAAHNLRLTELAHIDPLTGIANRRELDDYLDHFQHGPRPESIAIVMFDIDHFKPYNDRYGHAAGDECLRRVALVLRASLRRSSDLVARYGGEEFVVVLPGFDARLAQQVAERMHQAVFDLGIPHDASPVSTVVTLSAGVAAAGVGTDVQSIVQMADAALYRAKSAGRNCIHE